MEWIEVNVKGVRTKSEVGEGHICLAKKVAKIELDLLFSIFEKLPSDGFQIALK